MAVKPDHGIDMAVNTPQRIKLFLAIAMLAILIQISACSDDTAALVKGKPTPEFSLQSLKGDTVNFPDQFINQVTIISFWADWCPSCYKEMQDFEKLFQQYKNQELSIIAINIEQDKETAQAFIKNLNLSYDILLDSNGDIAKSYRVSSLPAAFILNRGGKLNTRERGETPAEVFEKTLRPLL